MWSSINRRVVNMKLYNISVGDTDWRNDWACWDDNIKTAFKEIIHNNDNSPVAAASDTVRILIYVYIIYIFWSCNNFPIMVLN
jgi:hypothetical protein